MLKGIIFWLLVISVGVTGSYALQEIKKHGKSRWWVAIPFLLLLSFYLFLVLRPGPFLWGIID